jgi:hypothetical protein
MLTTRQSVRAGPIPPAAAEQVSLTRKNSNLQIATSATGGSAPAARRLPAMACALPSAQCETAPNGVEMRVTQAKQVSPIRLRGALLLPGKGAVKRDRWWSSKAL